MVNTVLPLQFSSTLEWLQTDVGDAWFFACGSLLGDIPLMGYLMSHAVQGRFDNANLLATSLGPNNRNSAA
jgi:hypothetical protein